MATVLMGVLMLMQLALFALALGLTLLSFQAYRHHRNQRLEYAFIGFAFLSMGVALSTMSTQMLSSEVAASSVPFRIAETVPFIIGFGMLYVSLYR